MTKRKKWERKRLYRLYFYATCAAASRLYTSVSVVNNEHWPGLPFFLALALLSWTVRVLLKFIGKQHAVVSRVFDKGLQPLVISAQTHITKTSTFNKIINYTQESLSLVWENGGDVKRTLTLKHEGEKIDRRMLTFPNIIYVPLFILAQTHFLNSLLFVKIKIKQRLVCQIICIRPKHKILIWNYWKRMPPGFVILWVSQ